MEPVGFVVSLWMWPKIHRSHESLMIWVFRCYMGTALCCCCPLAAILITLCLKSARIDSHWLQRLGFRSHLPGCYLAGNGCAQHCAEHPPRAIWCLKELQAPPGRDSCTDKRRPLPLGHPSSHIWWELASGCSALRVWKNWDRKKREILKILAKLQVKSQKLQAGIVYVVNVLPQSFRWLQINRIV